LWVGEINYVGFSDILDLQDFECTISWNKNGPIRSRQIEPLFEIIGVKFGITINSNSTSALNGEFISAFKSNIVQTMSGEQFQTIPIIVQTKSSRRRKLVKSHCCDKFKTVVKNTLCQKDEMEYRVGVRLLPIGKWHSTKIARVCDSSELSEISSGDLYTEFNAPPIASVNGGGSSVNVKFGDGYGGSVNVQNSGGRRRSIKVPPDANANNFTMPKLTVRKRRKDVDAEVEKLPKFGKIEYIMSSFIQFPSSSFLVAKSSYHSFSITFSRRSQLTVIISMPLDGKSYSNNAFCNFPQGECREIRRVNNSFCDIMSSELLQG
jgi:hypothetical protein